MEKKGDVDGNITFTGKGENVTDYILAQKRIRNLIVGMELINETSSEHIPVQRKNGE